MLRSMAAHARRILVGFDGSDAAQRALDAAAGLIGYGSTLAVANVAPKGAHTANIVLSEAREHLLERHLRATYLPLYGDPADELIGAAHELDVDLVVIGSRNHTGNRRPALGSVSGDVVRRAPCDVLVVRSG